jgi:hypothetical protein
MPGRIKGANSDYKYVKGGQLPIVEEKGNDLYLGVFLCPGEAPSRVEENDGPGTYCEGTTVSCPKKTPGHARIHLDKVKGASLETDNNNRVVVDQAGNILLGSVNETKVQNKLSVTNASNQVLLSVSGNELTIQIGKSKFVVSDAGIELHSADKKGSVTINGDLKVTGALNVTGDLAVSGKICGNGALTDYYKQILDKVVAKGLV